MLLADNFIFLQKLAMLAKSLGIRGCEFPDYTGAKIKT